MRRLLLVVVLVSLPPAVVMVALTALAGAAGLPTSWTGLALGLMAGGSLVGGLTVGNRWIDATPQQRLVRMAAVSTTGLLALVLAAAPGRPLLVLLAMPLVGWAWLPPWVRSCTP